MIAFAEGEALDNTANTAQVSLHGNEGNDKIEGPHLIDSLNLYGGQGNDKLIGGNDNDTQTIYGEDNDDIIYGGDRAVTS